MVPSAPWVPPTQMTSPLVGQAGALAAGAAGEAVPASAPTGVSAAAQAMAAAPARRRGEMLGNCMVAPLLLDGSGPMHELGGHGPARGYRHGEASPATPPVSRHRSGPAGRAVPVDGPAR